GRDGRIDGIATLVKHELAGAGAEVMSRRDHAMPAHQHGPRGKNILRHCISSEAAPRAGSVSRTQYPLQGLPALPRDAACAKRIPRAPQIVAERHPTDDPA